MPIEAKEVFGIGTYDSAGRRASMTQAADTSLTVTTYYSHGQDVNGRYERTWGGGAYPVEYRYDPVYGRRETMTTYQVDTTGLWTQGTWPTPAPTGQTTTWVYDEPTGLLTAKQYADSTETQYQYTLSGQLWKRIWARTGNPTTEYTYDPDTGELTEIDYSDATQDVTFTYNRLGQQATVEDVVGTRTFEYRTSDLQLDTEDIVAGQNGLYSRLITRKYQTTGTGTLAGRAAGFRIGSGAPYEYDVTYAYDAKGRFETITGTGLPAGGVVYERLKDAGTVVSELMGKHEYRDGSSNVLASAVRSYEPDRDLLTSVENKAGSPLATVSKYTYRNDALGRRQDVVYTGSAFAQSHLFKWGYNSRSELATADRYQGTTPDNPGTQCTTQGAFDFAYDAIGNP